MFKPVLISSLMLLFAWIPARGQVPDFPTYRAEPCCDLCPAASVHNHYDTNFLKDFRTLIQGKDGWLFRTEIDLQMQFGPSEDWLKSLQLFRNALARKGTELVIVMQPTRGLMHPEYLPDQLPVPFDPVLARKNYAAALQRIRKTGVRVAALEQLPAEGGKGTFYFRHDHHWTPAGARRAATLVAQDLRALPIYKTLPRLPVATRRSGLNIKYPTMEKAASSLCATGFATQYFDKYVSEAPEADESALLDAAAAAPPITLVGTSNSDTDYNFQGYLTEFLQTDVLNASVKGGGVESAMLAYLPSAEFQGGPPRILIWELQPYHFRADPKMFRQAMPLIDNGCEESKPLLVSRVKLHHGRNEVLFNRGVRSLKSRQSLLDIRFSDPNIRELQGVIWYTDGTKEKVSVKRAKRVQSDGRFVYNLRDEGAGGGLTFLYMEIEVSVPATENLRLDARLCTRT